MQAFVSSAGGEVDCVYNRLNRAESAPDDVEVLGSVHQTVDSQVCLRRALQLSKSRDDGGHVVIGRRRSRLELAVYLESHTRKNDFQVRLRCASHYLSK